MTILLVLVSIANELLSPVAHTSELLSPVAQTSELLSPVAQSGHLLTYEHTQDYLVQKIKILKYLKSKKLNFRQELLSTELAISTALPWYRSCLSRCTTDTFNEFFNEICNFSLT